MEVKLWEIFTSLGVPGVALGVLYMLFSRFNWKLPIVPKKWVGPLLLVFMFIVGGIVFYTLSIWAPYQHTNDLSENKPKKTHDNKHLLKEESITSDHLDETDNLFFYSNIPDEQIRRNISKELERGGVDKAIKLLEYLRSETAKDEETEVIFNYCIANKKLGKAKLIIKLFRLDSLRKAAEKKLSYELLKNDKIKSY